MLRDEPAMYETHEPDMILHPRTKNRVKSILRQIKEKLNKEETEHEQG